MVYGKVREILLKHGTIHDEAKKFFGLISVLDYGVGERKLKVEISGRNFNDKYEIKNLLGVNMNNKTPLNRSIVETRMEMPLTDFIQKCIGTLEKMSDKGILNGLGELMDLETKKFVRSKLRTETITLLKFYKQYPILTQS